MMPKNLWKKCTFDFNLVGKRGHQTLEVQAFYKKKRIATFNWCGGISHSKKFNVSYNEITKREKIPEPPTGYAL